MSKRLPIPKVLPRLNLSLKENKVKDTDINNEVKEKVQEEQEPLKPVETLDPMRKDMNQEKLLEKVEKKTMVVSVKVASIRPKYDDLRQWMADPQNVYIARKGVVLLDNPETGKKARFPLSDSKFANPFTVKDHGLDKCIELYRIHIKKLIELGTITRVDLDELKGKNLGCWCKPGPCHGDVLLEFI
jgi:hypothetical protein